HLGELYGRLNDIAENFVTRVHPPESGLGRGDGLSSLEANTHTLVVVAVLVRKLKAHLRAGGFRKPPDGEHVVELLEPLDSVVGVHPADPWLGRQRKAVVSGRGEIVHESLRARYIVTTLEDLHAVRAELLGDNRRLQIR